MRLTVGRLICGEVDNGGLQRIDGVARECGMAVWYGSDWPAK